MLHPPRYLKGAHLSAWARSGDTPFARIQDPITGVRTDVYGLAIGHHEHSQTICRFSCRADWSVIQEEGFSTPEEARAFRSDAGGPEPDWQSLD